jgi:hypothetical protein
MKKIHTRVVIDIFSEKVLEDEFFWYDGGVDQCKGGSTSSSSKPLDLDAYMKGTLYPALQQQYSYLSSQYPASQSFEDWLSSNKSQQGTLESTLGNAQSSLGSLSGLTQSLLTPEAYSASMQPYLTKAYQGIGYSGMPGGSYTDKTLGEAVQQGYMSNLGNILGASQAEQSQMSQISDLVNAMNTLTGQEYSAKTEPLDFIKAIQSGRYNQSISKSSQSSGGGLLSMFG